MTFGGVRGDVSRVIVITGANSGVGFGIAQKLISEYLDAYARPPTLVLACRNATRAQAARTELLDKFFPLLDSSLPRHLDSIRSRKVGEEILQIQLVDLSSTASVFKACEEIKKKFNRIDTLYLNAGFIPIKGMNILAGLKNLLTRPSYVAKTGGDVIQQHVGIMNSEGLGDCFAGNVFGHWIMVRELQGLLEKAHGRIVWSSSTTADPTFFDPKDYQCIQGQHPYESNKRLCELLSFHISQTLSSKGIQSFVSSPGNCQSNITKGNVNTYVLLVVLYLMRLCFCSGINISPINAATSAVYLHEAPGQLDPIKLYHSDITPWGKKWVKTITLEQDDIEDVVKEMDKLVDKYRKTYQQQKSLK